MPEKSYVLHTLPGGATLDRLLGAGAFAQVYRAVDASGAQLAVKVLVDLSENSLALFTRELSIMRELPPSPNRVAYVGDGKMEDGAPYLSMEFVDGGTLRKAMSERGAWPVAEAAELMAQLCDALHGLHQLGVVHRDLKPDNILLTRDGNVKLSDFGLVKDAQGLLKLFEKQDILRGRDFSNEFDRKLVLGTPDFMAPEQFSDPLSRDGTQEKTDTWTDVYSVGLIFYQLLTGRKLWAIRAVSGMGVDFNKSMAAFIRLRVSPESERNVTRPPEIPEGLWPIISRTVRHDPKRRPHTAEELGKEIRHFMAHGSDTGGFDDTATEAVNMKNLSSLNPELLALVRKTSAASKPKPPPPRPVAPPPKPVLSPAGEDLPDASEFEELKPTAAVSVPSVFRRPAAAPVLDSGFEDDKATAAVDMQEMIRNSPHLAAARPRAPRTGEHALAKPVNLVAAAESAEFERQAPTEAGTGVPADGPPPQRSNPSLRAQPRAPTTGEVPAAARVTTDLVRARPRGGDPQPAPPPVAEAPASSGMGLVVAVAMVLGVAVALGAAYLLGLF
jgi:serine/threonine-protein kinase